MFEQLFTYIFSGAITILLIIAGWLIRRDVHHIDKKLDNIDHMLIMSLERLARGDEKFESIERRMNTTEKVIDVLIQNIKQ